MDYSEINFLFTNQYPRNIYLKYTRNSEADALEFLEDLEDYMYLNVNNQPHISVLPVAEGLNESVH